MGMGSYWIEFELGEREVGRRVGLSGKKEGAKESKRAE